MEISCNKGKMLVNSIKPRTSTNIMDEWENAGKSGPIQLLRIHTNQRRNINKGSEDQTGACTLSHDKTSNAISFPTNIKLYKTLAVSILLYRCESWTLTADMGR